MARSIRMKQLRLPLVAAALLATSAGIAFAAATPEQTIKNRQQHLKDLGAALKTVRDQTRTSQPDMAQIRTAGDTIAKAATEMNAWFPKGSGPESKVETDAKAEIWADPTGFEKAMKNFQAEAPKLKQLAAANDVDGVKAHVAKLGGTCKGCHDTYRVPQN